MCVCVYIKSLCSTHARLHLWWCGGGGGGGGNGGNGGGGGDGGSGGDVSDGDG